MKLFLKQNFIAFAKVLKLVVIKNNNHEMKENEITESKNFLEIKFLCIYFSIEYCKFSCLFIHLEPASDVQTLHNPPDITVRKTGEAVQTTLGTVASAVSFPIGL